MLRGKGIQEQSSTQVSTPSVISDQSTERNTLRSKLTNKRVVIGLIVVTILLVVSGAATYLSMNQQSPRSSNGLNHDAREGINTSSDPEDLKSPIVKLEENPPTNSAGNAEKAAYYSKLAHLHADMSDYKAAIAAFSREESIAGDSMTYQDYHAWAYCYEQIGDKQAAIEKLQKELTMLPEMKATATSNSTEVVSAQISARIEELSR